MSTFPDDFDSDIEIPRIEQNVSEISGDVINSLRDAMFALQRAIGLNPQGNKADFTSRMNVSIDANGYIKRNALENVGLISLPVVNRHVGSTAGIEESKLSLDYGTRYLKNLLDSLRLDLDGTLSGHVSVSAGFNSHILGQGNYHDGYHIRVNSAGTAGYAGLSSTTIGDVISDLVALLIAGNDSIDPHIDLGIPSSVKHRASGISVNSTNFTIIDRTSTNVQEAFDSLDEQSGALGISHVDMFHDNGILKEVDSGTTYNADRELLSILSSTVGDGGSSGASWEYGSSVVTLPGVTSISALNIVPGDILVIPSSSNVLDAGSYQIRATGPLLESETLGGLPTLDSNQVSVFHTFLQTKESGMALKIYKPATVSSNYAPLACSVRNNETLVDTISIMNPDAAHVVSVGFNGSIMSTDGYSVCIRAGTGGGQYRELLVTGLHFERLGTNRADPVDSTSVAERINAYVSDPDLGYHFPASAYRIGNEIAIAHNWVGPDYTIEILDGYTANFSLGLDAYGADVAGEEIVGNNSSTYSVNGVSLSTIKTVFSGYSSITSDTSTFMLYDSDDQLVNPLKYGIGPGSVMHVSGHPVADENGSYTVYTSNTTSVTIFNPETISAPVSPTTFDVWFTGSNVPLSVLDNTETDMGVAQIFVDPNGETFLHQRVMYGTNIGSAFEIANLSDTFPSGQITIIVGFDGSFITFNIMSDTIPGSTVRIHEDFKGSFKLYHPNGLDYLNVNIIEGSISGAIETVIINDPIPADQGFLLCTAHFNGTLSVTNLVDERLFGNLSSNQIRDDFIEIFSQRPVSDLRSNGVARGFDLMALVYEDSVSRMQAVPISGGVAYVNGVRVAVETQKVIIQSFDEDGDIISGDRIIGINDFGSLQVVTDQLGEMLEDGYNSSVAYGKVLPLYRVTVTNGIIGDIVDLRRFINNIDDKMDMIIDESNNLVGNFMSLEGALLYAANYPNKERLTIRIINSVTPTNHLTVSAGVSIVGGAPYGGSGKHRIVNSSNRNRDFITLLGDNILENIEIVSTTAGLQGSLVAANGENISIEKCLFRFDDTISSNSGDVAITVGATRNVNIINNRISSVYTGISCTDGCEDLVISGNTITEISGIGVSSGITIGSSLRSVDNIRILNNIIEFSTVSNTDLRGIDIDLTETIDTIRICDNKISCGLNVNDRNYLSNGIRVENSSGTGNKVSRLIISQNHIENVKLYHTQVYGAYISFVENVVFDNNVMVNVGVYNENYTDVSYIWSDDNVDLIEVRNNVLIDGDARMGVYIKNSSTLASILNNTIKNIGETSANYIYGLAHRSNVSGNKLIGPGNYGIWWKGQMSKISNNHLASDGVDYAFKTGILLQQSYIDVENNTIMDMTDDESIGIGVYNSSNNGIKIVGNTIIGDTMHKLIELKGSYHVVSNNRLRNDTESVGGAGETHFVYMSGSNDSITINGNTFEGINDSGAIGTTYIYSPGEVTNTSITNNHMLAAEYSMTLTSAPIRLVHSDVANCFVAGNFLPPKSSYQDENRLGQLVLAWDTNTTNTIGVNKGMLDSRSLHACEGITAYDSSGAADYSEYPHWVFNDSNSYWEINSLSTTDTRYLYFPISCIPNGATLKYVALSGKHSGNGDSVTFEFEVLKRSMRTVNVATSEYYVDEYVRPAGGNEGDANTVYLSTVSSEFGPPTDPSSGGTGVTNELSEVINYIEKSYYVRIKQTQASPSSPDDVRVYGVTIFFRY